MIFKQEKNVLFFTHQTEKIRIEAWGKDSLRVRSTKNAAFTGNDWALTEEKEDCSDAVKITIDGRTASITNGRIRADVNEVGILSFYRDGKLILREYYRSYYGTISNESRCLKLIARNYKPIIGGDYSLTMRFESNDGEKLYGMGQYQQPYLELKGCVLELAQRNSQISIPFTVSSLGYGFLWNNPGVGSVSFGKNYTEWVAQASKEIDYWITVADAPRGIIENYTAVTGRAPIMRNDVLGLWQCKLRYRTQDEVLSVARKYKELGIPLDVIVIDFFHWTRQGDCLIIDVTNPEAREFIWEKCKKNYYEYGIDMFWLDNAEPDLAVYDYDNYRYHMGTALEVANIYPKLYAKAFTDGIAAEGNADNMLHLVRCGWVGSQKYSTLIWSGDVPSTFESLQDQLAAGLNMGLAGIPWWTTDIGGFMTDDVADPVFRELLIRWYEFAVFTPILRMHGDRGPHNIPPLSDKDFGGGYLYTGQPNELWSYGEDNMKIMLDYLKLRWSLKPYIEKLMKEAHEDGSPLMRTMFYEFPDDAKCWEVIDQYMFGDKYLVAPILEAGRSERKVYLPAGKWENIHDHRIYEGSDTITCDAPLDIIPVFERK